MFYRWKLPEQKEQGILSNNMVTQKAGLEYLLKELSHILYDHQHLDKVNVCEKVNQFKWVLGFLMW